MGVDVSSCMDGICSLLDGSSHFLHTLEEKNRKKKRKNGCLFSDVGFQAEEPYECCSLQATESARLTRQMQSCLSARRWEEDCADCLCL